MIGDPEGERWRATTASRRAHSSGGGVSRRREREYRERERPPEEEKAAAPEGGWPTVRSRQEGESSFLFFVSLGGMRKEKKE